ncbi:DUF2867 domain-containing protein [uncultured Pseudodesulfovibrio sp.]|uniref:DUF2867 domain-containing protein n=1 Tax=uncultured Pseudodesulfovibrio sp. TaxID=2035858 RepID=UPI0029C61818|nr:DUF2867 domain-containing protein [uncultured Pseudodesulfovibrio sp.]
MNDERLSHVASLVEFMKDADHIDVKSCEGNATLIEFIAGILSYQPGWMRMLWLVRVWLLKALGQGEQIVPEKKRFTPQTFPVTPGEKADFFTVVESDGETFWVAEGKEKHLDAIIGVVVEQLDGEIGTNRFHVATIVKYNNSAGPIYFNLIRPFHHVVVHFAMKSVMA